MCTQAVLSAPQVSLRGFGFVHALWLYGGPVQHAIQRMKYGRRIEMAKALASEVSVRLLEDRQFDVLIPIPLTKKRLRSRGFNPALEICRATRFRTESSALVRIQAKHTQVGLGPMARRKNVLDAFVVKNPKRIRGKRVLLVDDVMTTGSTLLESGQVVRAAGAHSVEGLVLARTMIEDPNITVIDDRL